MTGRRDAAGAAAGIARAAALLRGRRRAVALTGAGLSTASGIADFRSPGGIWSRYRPVTIQEFLASDEARRRYWAYKRDTYEEFAGAAPNAGHEALARLESNGVLTAVVTQNIDGLHQRAGSRRVLELHGTNLRVECLGCDREYDRAAIQKRLLAGEAVPRCGDCGGFLKPATVSFGQALPADVLAEAAELARTCGCLLALGSSLVVQPAAELPLVASRAGAALIVVNREPTPVDALADVVIHGDVSRVLPALAAQVAPDARD
jgi:NAD-dependent deacetylase